MEFDGEILTTKDGVYIWSELTRILALARDRITVHDIYYHFEFGEKVTAVFEDDKGSGKLVEAMIGLQGFNKSLHTDIFRAKITHGDYVLYEKS